MSSFATLQDFRHAWRAISQNPLLAGVAVVSLAVGIGANTAIFTLLDQLLLRPMPVRDPQRLVQLELPGPRSGNNWTNRSFSYPMYKSLRDGNTSLDGLAAQFLLQGSFSTADVSEVIQVQMVSGNWFQTVGLTMALGRPIGPEDEVTMMGHPVVVLTHAFWQRRFAGDKSILQKTVLLNGQRMTIIGVAAGPYRGTDVLNPADILLPVSMQPLLMPNASFPAESPRLTFLQLFGRVKQGVTLDQVRADLNRVVAPVLLEEIKGLNFRSQRVTERFLGKQFRLYPASTGNLTGQEQIEQAMWLLAALVGGVLLIACANVANLLLARATVRRRELAVRTALGASRWQLARLVLAESVLLSLLGGALGLLAANWAGDALLAFANTASSSSLPIHAAPDSRVLLFTFVLSILTGLVFGVGPALASASADTSPALKEEAGNLSGGAASAWVRRGLIVLQVALSLSLLAAASLFLRTLDNLRRVDPGFDADRLIAFSVNPSMNGYSLERQNTFYEQLTQELSALPGVSAVTMAAEPLLAESMSQSTVRVEGYTPSDDEDMNPFVNEVGPSFFRTMAIPLLEGRDFAESDGPGAMNVAIVSDTFAKRYFKDGSAVGRKLGFGRHNRPPYITIVGVIKEPLHLHLRDGDTKRQVYTPSAQAERVGGRTFYLRTPAGLALMAPAIRSAAGKMDATVPVVDIRTMPDQIEVSLTLERIISLLCAAFGLIATLMAAVGLYGVMAFHVSRRTREIGIRLALGAQRSDVAGLVLREAVVLTALGIGVGVPAAVGLGRFARGILYGVEPNDVLTFAGTAALLLVTAVTASLLPARRAARVEPIQALRYE